VWVRTAQLLSLWTWCEDDTHWERLESIMAPGMFRGKVSSVGMVKVYTSWLFKVY
jgi:hypothetical protein